MGETEGSVLRRKHIKPSPGTPPDRPGWWDVVRSRASTATPRGLAVAGVGGAGASVTTVVAHPVGIIPALGVCGVFAVGYVAACVLRYIDRKPAITDARSKAQARKMRAETQGRLMEKAAEDPTKAPAIERMIGLQNQAALIDEAEKLGEHAASLAAHLASQRPSRVPGRKPPGDKGGGEYPRAV